MDRNEDQYDQLLQVGARRLKGHQRRLFQAEICLKLCDGNPRRAEQRFGPQTLEISMDTKAKVKIGEYVQGGKMSHG